MYDNWIHSIIESYLNNIVEGNTKKLSRVRGAAYDASKRGDGEKHARLASIAGDLQSKVDDSRARRGGATDEEIRQTTPYNRGRSTGASSSRYAKRNKAISSFIKKSRERQIAEELLNSLDEGLMQKIAAGVVGGALASGVGCGSNKNEPCPTPTPTVKAGAEGELFNKKTTPSAKSPTTKPKPTYKAKKGTGAEGEFN